MYEPQWYKSPIDLPEGVSGDVVVSHRHIEPGQKVTIIGMRQALLRGIRAASGIAQQRIRIHELSHNHRGVWMTDLPEELNQIGEMLYDVMPMGRVLVGGLGLGILATTLANRVGVDKVTVVEINPDVIKLCARPGYTVVNADIVEYLRTSNEEFDFFLLDTWQGTNEGTWWSEVMPQRRLIRQRWGKSAQVHCWAEDIMHGQIFNSLVSKQPHWYYTGLPVPMTPRVARAFLRDVGSPAWEAKYGSIIDANMRKGKEI